MSRETDQKLADMASRLKLTRMRDNMESMLRTVTDAKMTPRETLEYFLNKPEFADLFYAYGVLDSGRFIGESSHLVGLGSNQASFYLRA